MTVLTETLSDQFPGNGTTDEFDIGFEIFDSSELIVRLIDDSTGEAELLVEGVDYEIDSTGSTVTLTDAPADGFTLDLRPIYEVTQPTSIKNQTTFRPDVHELVFDRLASQQQMLLRLIRRAPHLADYGEDDADLVLPALADRIGMFSTYDVNGNPSVASGTGNDPDLRTDLASGVAALVDSQSISYRRTDAEIAAGVTPADYTVPSHETCGKFILKRYGGDPTGATSSHTAWNNLMAVVAEVAHGGVIEVWPGDYLFSSQPILTTQDEHRLWLDARGATFRSSGAITTLRVSGGTTNGGVSILGLQFDDHANANVIAGVDVIGTSRTRLYECHFRPGANSATYTYARWRNSVAADPETGAYWGLLADCSARRLSGADGAVPNYGVTVQGSANAMEFRGGQLGDAMSVVRIVPEATQSAVANGVVGVAVALENYVTGVLLDGAAASELGGFRWIGGRFECGTALVGTKTMFSWTGSTTQPAAPPITAHNYATPDTTVHTNNPNSLRVLSFDSSVNPGFAPVLDLGGPITARNRSGNLGILDLRVGLNDAGIILRDQDGTTNLTIKAQASGVADIIGTAADKLRLMGVMQLNFTVDSANGQMVYRATGVPAAGTVANGSIALRTDPAADAGIYQKIGGTQTAVDNV